MGQLAARQTRAGGNRTLSGPAGKHYKAAKRLKMNFEDFIFFLRFWVVIFRFLTLTIMRVSGCLRQGVCGTTAGAGVARSGGRVRAREVEWRCGKSRGGAQEGAGDPLGHA